MKEKTPWSTKAVMQQIYDKHLWGGNTFDFYSGEGSHQPNIIEPYIEVVLAFLKSKNNKLTVCDLGCGDFNIGKHFVEFTQKYIAIDIVEELIKRNKSKFKADHLEFLSLDISKDSLAKADCIILRQVLQHLSNAEIKRIVSKLSNYKYIILTEHIPVSVFTPNKDILTGQGIRLKLNSGVDVLAEPFNLKAKSTRILDEYILNQNKGKIITTLIELT
jgi:hypothetical protein